MHNLNMLSTGLAIWHTGHFASRSMGLWADKIYCGGSPPLVQQDKSVEPQFQC